MSKGRSICGTVGGVVIILSAFAHSVLGGKGMTEQLVAAKIPAEFLFGVQLGWQFGGAAMLALGVIVLLSFLRRGAALPSLLPARIIAITYLLFGAVALVVSSFDPFFLTFVVPGLLIGIGSFGGGSLRDAG
jgi:hypothetical protein